MPNEFDDILSDLAKDIAAEAKIALQDAKNLLAHTGPLALQWEAEARAFDASGDTARAAKKRMSIEGVKNAAVMDVATHAVVAIDKVERGILAAFDKALAMLP